MPLFHVNLRNRQTGPLPRVVKFLPLLVVAILLSGGFAWLVSAQGASTSQIDAWGGVGKGGPQCSASGCYESPQAVAGLNNVVMIDASNDFNLAILSNGTVMAWGQNAYGQLGNGKTSKGYTAPVQVAGLNNVIATATGNHDSFALLSNGTVMSWGYNDRGSLGNGARNNSSMPELIPHLSNVIAIAAGGDHAYALLSNHTIMAWGGNTFGQLGNGNTKNSPVPVAVSNISNATAISSGNQFGDALLSNGTVVDWGYNAFGQLGNGTTTNSSMPVPVRGLTGVTEISAGGNLNSNGHNMALLSNGTIMTWGCNGDGQLGNGTTTNSSIPVAVKGLAGQPVAIAAGGAHSMALLSNGTVETWGQNAFGQLGNGTLADSSTPVSVLSNAELISAGSEHSLAALTPSH